MKTTSRSGPFLGLLCVLALIFAGCPAKKTRKKPRPKKPNYEKKWHDILELGERGQFEIKEGRRAVAQAQNEQEKHEGHMQIVGGVKGILEAINRADQFFKLMGKLYPEIDTGGYEDQVAEWNQDYSHAKKQLPLKYAEEFN
jgi:hypothetical protein